MSEAHTQERTRAAARSKAGSPKPLNNADASAPQPYAGLRLPDFAPGFSAAADSWGTLVRAAQSINREHAIVFNKEVDAVTAEMEILRHSETVPDVTNSLLKCAQLQSDLAVHSGRVVSDIIRQTWFDILSRWGQTVKSPLPDFLGFQTSEPTPSNRPR